jgi:hypothetical protein
MDPSYARNQRDSVGQFTGSISLFVDGIDSLSDAAVSFFERTGLHFALRRPSRGFPLVITRLRVLLPSSPRYCSWEPLAYLSTIIPCNCQPSHHLSSSYRTGSACDHRPILALWSPSDAQNSQSIQYSLSGSGR